MGSVYVATNYETGISGMNRGIENVKVAGGLVGREVSMVVGRLGCVGRECRGR